MEATRELADFTQTTALLGGNCRSTHRWSACAPHFDDELWRVALKSDPFLKSGPIALTPGLVARMLRLEEGHCLRDHTLIAGGAVPPAPPAPSAPPAPPAPPAHHAPVEATSLLTLVEMIASGLGIGRVPARAVNSGVTRGRRLIVRRMPAYRPRSRA